MKKTLLPFALLLLCLSSCLKAPAGSVAVDALKSRKTVLVNDGGIKASFLGVEYSANGASLNFEAENSTNAAAAVEIRDISINKMAIGEPALKASVKPGSKAKGSIAIPEEKLKDYGIEEIGLIELEIGSYGPGGEALFANTSIAIKASKSEAAPPKPSIKETIFGQYGVNISLVSFAKKEGAVCARLFISNDRNERLTIYPESEAVNGFTAESNMRAIIAPKRSAAVELCYSDKDIGKAGYICEMELVFVIEASDTYRVLYKTDLKSLKNDRFSALLASYDLNSSEAKAKPGAKTLFSKKSIRLTYEPLAYENNAFAAECLLDNGSGQNASIELKKAKINGAEISAEFKTRALAGKKSYSALLIPDSALTKAGISKIKSIELTFEAKSYSNEILFETVAVIDSLPF